MNQDKNKSFKYYLLVFILLQKNKINNKKESILVRKSYTFVRTITYITMNHIIPCIYFEKDIPVNRSYYRNNRSLIL
jgi:hypothetical protein